MSLHHQLKQRLHDLSPRAFEFFAGDLPGLHGPGFGGGHSPVRRRQHRRALRTGERRHPARSGGRAGEEVAPAGLSPGDGPLCRRPRQPLCVRGL